MKPDYITITTILNWYRFNLSRHINFLDPSYTSLMLKLDNCLIKEKISDTVVWLINSISKDII